MEIRNYFRYFIGLFALGFGVHLLLVVSLRKGSHAIAMMLTPLSITSISAWWALFAETVVGSLVFSLPFSLCNGFVYGLVGLVAASTVGKPKWKKIAYPLSAFVLLMLVVPFLILFMVVRG
jgi:hypothetical protein